MQQTLITSQRVIKAMIFVILAAFMFAQFAAANHTHETSDNGPEPSICAICIVASHSDDDLNIPLPTILEPSVIEISVFLVLAKIETQSNFTLFNLKAPIPPDIRRSAPRAPPR